MYAIADEDRDWAYKARLSPSERAAITEAIAGVDVLELVLKGLEGDDDQKGLLLEITLATLLTTWGSDLIALE